VCFRHGRWSGATDGHGRLTPAVERNDGQIRMTRFQTHIIGVATSLLVVMPLPPAHAEEASSNASGESLLEKSQNPISDLISVPFQFNVNFNVGQLDGTQMLLNVQPVYPATLNEKWNLIIRPITPVIYNPALVPGGASTFGIGDLNPQFFFSPSTPARTTLGDLTWGVGPAFLLPTASHDPMGTGKWSAAPAAVVFFLRTPFTYGALIQNYFSFAGEDGRPDVNQFVMQPFLNYNLGKGWSLGTAPIIIANWEADERRWTLPLGGGVTKLIKFRQQPVSLILRGYHNVLRP